MRDNPESFEVPLQGTATSKYYLVRREKVERIVTNANRRRLYADAKVLYQSDDYEDVQQYRRELAAKRKEKQRRRD